MAERTFTKLANGGEVDNAYLDKLNTQYGTGASDAYLKYLNEYMGTGPQQVVLKQADEYMQNWKPTPTKVEVQQPVTSPTVDNNPTNGNNLVGNNINEGKNEASQTMTVGTDNSVNYTNATTSESTTPNTEASAEAETMPKPSVRRAAWLQNTNTFGASDENEKQPIQLAKTVYWKRRRG